MPRGFKIVRFAGSGVNTYQLCDNCYYCSVAALLGYTVEELFKKIETMQQTGANKEEITALFREAGVSDIACDATTDPQAVYHAIKSFPNGESVGLAYTRQDGSGHMIVATRDDGYVNNFVNEGVKCVDYQRNPPKVTGFPPETQIAEYLVFYRS
jgi:hypothetical protein